ncbi:hypothetical protein CPLU01_15808 [Colletotrichum plurivorum]|uniref:Uncharacterized protein n=1 Tax=Colletotrichum plurivorum TaxID=2175906 RepID=A0A8H6MT74_9PEZI|nr:hypothetical protein CPLU01_15808 [Colletotrichum plurivorum]
MDAARLVSSLNIAEELTFKRGHLRNNEKADIFYYLESTPLANQAAVTLSSLPWSSGPLSACREPGPHTLDERSFGVTIRSLSTVTASELLVGAFLLEGNRPVCPYPAYIFVNPMGRLDVTIANEWGFSWAMGGYVGMEKLEELNVDLKDRYQDLRRLERPDVGWEGRYLNLHRIMGRCLTYKSPNRGDSCDDQVRHPARRLQAGPRRVCIGAPPGGTK